jgi:hypothetical protein
MKKRASVEEDLVLDCFRKSWRDADFWFSIGFGECIGDLAPMQNHQLSSSELTYF